MLFNMRKCTTIPIVKEKIVLKITSQTKTCISQWQQFTNFPWLVFVIIEMPMRKLTIRKKIVMWDPH